MPSVIHAIGDPIEAGHQIEDSFAEVSVERLVVERKYGVGSCCFAEHGEEHGVAEPLLELVRDLGRSGCYPVARLCTP